VAGDGPQKRELMGLAKGLGIDKRVKWLGMVDRNKLPNIYSQCTVFVTMSTMETLGLVVLEAMACGIPVVGVNAFALPDLIKNGKNGFLREPNDIWGVAESIIKLLEDQKLRTKFKANALLMAQKHDVFKITRELEGVYAKLVNEGKINRPVLS